MTPAEYWNGDPRLTVSYREAYEMKIKAENQKLWLQGLYIYDGVSDVLCIDKHKKKGYPKEPYEILPPSEEELKLRAERERKKVVDQLTAFKNAWDIKHGG